MLVLHMEHMEDTKMGADLTLLPFYSPRMNDDSCFSHDVVDLERRKNLWTQIQEIEGEAGFNVPDDFFSFLGRDDICKGTHYGKTTKTPSGSHLKYVFAKDLKKLATHEGVLDNYKNRAAWAYLEQVPDELKVALFWHY